MKLQLNEETLNAYISEAIKQELDEGLMNNRVLVDFSKLGNNGVPENPETKNKFLWMDLNKKARNKLQNTTNSWGKGYHFPAYLSWKNGQSLISTMKKLGYSDDQILIGMKNGAFQFGEVKDGEFIPHSKKNQNKIIGNMLAAMGKTYLDLQNAGNQEQTNTGGGGGLVRDPEGQNQTQPQQTGRQKTYPWESITQEEINQAKQAQQKARQAKQQQTKQQQPREKVAAVNPNPNTPVNTPGAEVRKAPVNPTPSNPVNTPGVTAPAQASPQAPATQPNFVTNTINAMGEQIRSGHPELAARTAQNAINAIQKNGTGSQQEKAAIQQIQAALANMTANKQ